MSTVLDSQTRIVVDRALARTPTLPSLPDVTLRVIRLAKAPQTSVQDLASVVSRSPALCLTMLRVVNSAFYGLPGRVTSIARAVSLLGVTGVRNLAVAASLSQVFTGRALSPTFGPRALWHHSLEVASASRLLAVAAGYAHPDEAFLAGLIHDIGFVVELHVDRDGLSRVIKRLDADPGLDMLATEREELGATHLDFGGALCERWQIPEVLAAAVGSHHAPLQVVRPYRLLATLVSLGDSVVAARTPYPLDRPVAETVAPLLWSSRLTRDQLEQVSDALPRAVDDALIFG